MKKMFGLLLIMSVMIITPGCSYLPSSDDSTNVSSDYTSQEYIPPLQTSPELRIKDLPVPAGFVYKPDKSMIIEYGEVIAGIIYYEGAVDAAELIGFYRREMPKYDWNLSSMIERNEVKMIFQKEGKICEIVLRAAAGLSKKSVISIYYAPRS